MRIGIWITSLLIVAGLASVVVYRSITATVSAEPARAFTVMPFSTDLSATDLMDDNNLFDSSDYHHAGRWGIVEGGPHHFYTAFPIWMPLGLVLAIIAIQSALFARKCHRQKRLGLCRHCGYDLRASTGRCPECGQTIETPSMHRMETP